MDQERLDYIDNPDRTDPPPAYAGVVRAVGTLTILICLAIVWLALIYVFSVRFRFGGPFG